MYGTHLAGRLLRPASPLLAMAWAACVLLILIGTVAGFPKGALSTDILDLLPSSSADVRTGELARAAASGVADRVIWAVADDPSHPGASEALVSGLRERGLVESLSGRMTDEDQKAWLLAMRRDAAGLLDDKTVRNITEKGAKDHLRWMLTQLYSPVAGVTGDEWKADPWLLLRSVMTGRTQNMPALTDGWITARDADGRVWRLLTGRVPESALSGDGLKSWISAEHALRSEVLAAHPGARIAGQGVVYYSHHAASQAERDMKRLGSLSCVLLAVFIFGAFRSFRPVLLCLLSVSAGALCGTAATLAVFGSLHAVTLVMCLSLIGISADYTTYYLVRRRWAGNNETPAGTLSHLRPSLLHALLTTTAAYALMLAAPFPGLQQLALFAVCGLAGAWITVVAWFPFLVKGFPVRPLPAHGLLSAYAGAFTKRCAWTKVFLAVFCIGSIAGIARLNINDDLAALQTPPVALASEEKVISGLLGIGFSQTWFAVTGLTDEGTMKKLEAFRPTLGKLEKDGVISRPVIVPLRSLEVQERAIAAMKAAEPAMAARLAPPCEGEACTPYKTVTLREWVKSPMGDGYRSLVSETSDGVVIFVPVSLAGSSKASAAAAGAASEAGGVYWLNRRADFGTLFETFRLGLAGLIAAGLVILSLMLVRLLGVRRGLAAALPVAGGLIAGLAATGLTGMPVNLFSLFALILVMGIGVDYTIFFHSEEGGGSEAEPSDHVFYAMAVALGSTLLSLGILVLSETPAVRNFGLVLSAGVLFAFLLAPATRLLTLNRSSGEGRK